MHCHRHDINLSLFTKGVSMSSISSVGSSNAWSQTNMMRSRPPGPPGGADPATMFKKIDTDGSGGVDATELQTMFTDMASKSGNSGNTPDASKTISQFDANSDGSLDQSEMGKAMQSMMPPPNTMDFARQRSGGPGDACGGTQSSSSTSSDQTIQDLISSIDTNQDGSIDKSEMATFKQVLTESANGLTQDSSSSDSATTSTQSSMDQLARMVIQRYAAMASDTAQQGNLTSLSLAA
jgi:hypothetical protein